MLRPFCSLLVQHSRIPGTKGDEGSNGSNFGVELERGHGSVVRKMKRGSSFFL